MNQEGRESLQNRATEMAPSRRTAAVIGAGASGIAALRALLDAGVDSTVFELGDHVGGLWVYGNSNGLSAAYRSLHTNTIKESMGFAGFPMPATFPDYPHHTQVAGYLNSYLDSFGGRSRIRLRTEVLRVEPTTDRRWLVQFQGAEVESRDFDAVLVCSGHHWMAKWPHPAYEGTFAGQQLHSHEYREPSSFAGLRVLVVGMGNSAMDIAEDLTHVADATFISARHGQHILPKYMFGRPLGRITGPLMRLPWRPRQWVLAKLLEAWRGRYKRYGLQEPSVGIYQLHATLSDTILTRLAHRQIVAKPGIARLADKSVAFVDGSSEQVDAIIWCTGYATALPFLPGSPTTTPPLYLRMLPVDSVGLALIGFVSQRGALMPVVEAQSRLAAAYVTGTYQPPSRGAMEDEIRRYANEISRRYFHTERHALEVEQGPYVKSVNAELKIGLERAASLRTNTHHAAKPATSGG